MLIPKIKDTKKGQMIIEYHLTYKAPLVGSRSNRFWKDLKKLNIGNRLTIEILITNN